MATTDAQNGTVSGAGQPYTPTNPYDTFVQNNANLLNWALGQSNANNPGSPAAAMQSNIQGLKGTQATLATPGASNPLDFLFKGGGYTQADTSKQLEGMFNPSIVSNQAQAEAAAQMTSALPGVINSETNQYNATKPFPTSPGQSLMTYSGQVLQRNPQYDAPTIRPDTGNLDSWDSANGVWKSDTVSATGNGSGSNGYGNNSHPVTSTNNNPFGVKLTPFTQKLADGLGFATSTGTVALDGGVFAQLQNPAQGEKLARALLTSSVYADDTIDQAMKLWSNNGYDGSIVNGTGIAPTDHIKDLSGTQIDALMAKMKERETGISSQSTMTTAVGGQYSSEAAQRVQQIPQPMQKYVQAGPKGVAYIDAGRLSDLDANTRMGVQVQAAKAGIPWLDPQDVNNLKAMGVVYENVNKMNDLLKATLNGSSQKGSRFTPLAGGLLDMAKSTINNLSGQNAFPELAKFNAYRDVAVKAVQALAGGNGSGLRLTTGEIMASTMTLPDSTNSLDTAYNKLSGLLSLLDTNMGTNFPYSTGTGQPGASGAADIRAEQSGTASGQQTTPSGIKYTVVQ